MWELQHINYIRSLSCTFPDSAEVDLLINPSAAVLLPTTTLLLLLLPLPLPPILHSPRSTSLSTPPSIMANNGGAPPVGHENINTDIVTLTRFFTEEQVKVPEATGDFTYVLSYIILQE